VRTTTKITRCHCKQKPVGTGKKDTKKNWQKCATLLADSASFVTSINHSLLWSIASDTQYSLFCPLTSLTYLSTYYHLFIRGCSKKSNHEPHTTLLHGFRSLRVKDQQQLLLLLTYISSFLTLPQEKRKKKLQLMVQDAYKNQTSQQRMIFIFASANSL